MMSRMSEALYNANEELKRAEHLHYVSLKYTRTGDVILSVIERIVACFGFIIDGILEEKEEEFAIMEVPSSPFGKIKEMQNLFKNDKEMLNYMHFYATMRKILRSQGERKSEFRRNVTLTVGLEGKKVDLTIDIIGDYFHITSRFLHFVNDNYRKK